MDEIKRTTDGRLEGRASVEHDIQPSQGAAQTPSSNDGKSENGSATGENQA